MKDGFIEIDVPYALGAPRGLHKFWAGKRIWIPLPETVGDVARLYRYLRGCTQESVGVAIGVSGAWISRIENENVMPSEEHMVAISKYLGAPLEVFICAKLIEEGYVKGPGMDAMARSTAQMWRARYGGGEDE